MLFCAVFLWCALGSLALAADYESREIKVGLVYGASAVAEAVVGASGDLDVCSLEGSEETGHLLLEKPGSVTAKLTEECIALYQNGKAEPVASYNKSYPLLLRPVGGTITAKGREYRGHIRLEPINGVLHVINIVDFEHYLYGVVTQEMYASWPLEALKAQAVCSRTYLLSSGINRHKADGFDLCDGVHCQAYAGMAKEVENGIRAVDETAGQVVMYQGKRAQVFYYASSGGTTEDVSKVWGSTVYPYLSGVTDIYEKPSEAKYPWTVEYTPQELGTRFADYGYNIGDVTALNVLENTPSGRVYRLEATGTAGSCVLEREKTRTVLGLKSQLYTVDKAGLPALYIISESGTAAGSARRVISGAGTFSAGGDLTILSESGASPLVATPQKFVITGRGYGHGVGMSQWGAKAMADSGKTYGEIIAFYFPGVSIEAQ